MPSKHSKTATNERYCGLGRLIWEVQRMKLNLKVVGPWYLGHDGEEQSTEWDVAKIYREAERKGCRYSCLDVSQASLPEGASAEIEEIVGALRKRGWQDVTV